MNLLVDFYGCVCVNLLMCSFDGKMYLVMKVIFVKFLVYVSFFEIVIFFVKMSVVVYDVNFVFDIL